MVENVSNLPKIVSVVGARPQFIKAAALSPTLREQFNEVLVHTGQHYDYGMSEALFEQLALPAPDYNLGVGSGSHAQQTAAMLTGIEEVLLYEKPALLLTYGDTNSTIASALAAAKLHIPVAHVEAGLRSFNRLMPEEINRVATDHLSKLLFCPTQLAVRNLLTEGIAEGVFLTGDVMYDAIRIYHHEAERLYGAEPPALTSAFSSAGPPAETPVALPQSWHLATIHRAENTEDAAHLEQILGAFEHLSGPVVFPLHPRTRPLVQRLTDGRTFDNTLFVQPVGYMEMLYLTAHAQKVITDSGGLQKEAYLLQTPCVTVREQTEWIETLEAGWNVLVPPATEALLAALRRNAPAAQSQEPVYGDGHAAQQIVARLREYFGASAKAEAGTGASSLVDTERIAKAATDA
jgi:UDP-N-acetylglucosamine 2-epimerase (non-hydrolysing)/UDP-GlcNAc3NAcA epimerase